MFNASVCIRAGAWHNHMATCDFAEFVDAQSCEAVSMESGEVVRPTFITADRNMRDEGSTRMRGTHAGVTHAYIFRED